MKANLLSFPFINFSESGLFNGLRAKKIKNLPFYLGLHSGFWVSFAPPVRQSFSLLPLGTAASAIEFAIAIDRSVDFCFAQENVAEFVNSSCGRQG
jgi:hypothetical protein